MPVPPVTTTAIMTPALVQAAAKSAIDTFVTPKFQQLKDFLSLSKSTITHDYIEHQFTEYVQDYYNKYSIINTIALDNQQRPLKSLYIPLTLVRTDTGEKHNLTEYTDSFLPRYQRIIVTDTAGMGKSTLTKRLFLSIVENNIGIPIIIELRRLSQGKKIIDEIIEQLNPINDTVHREFVLKLIARGDFIFFMDGYDEIKPDDKVSVIDDMQSFFDKASNNLFLITSRPDDALTSFGDFMKFNIQGLSAEEAFELLRKYDNYGELSNLLIEKVKESFDNVKEFLSNPLLVSLLYLAFDHKQIIPFRKHIFYRQVYDALFESHDLSKGSSFERTSIRKCNKLDSEDYHRVLRFMGYDCLKSNNTEFSKDEIINLIDKARRFCPDIDFKPADFLKDVTLSAPIFNIDGLYFKWSHKSLLEYFAAQFIQLDAKGQQEAILKKLTSSSSNLLYLNALELYSSIDPLMFRRIVVKNFLQEYLDIYNTVKSNLHYNHSEIERRTQATFFYEYLIIRGINNNKAPEETRNEIVDKYFEIFRKYFNSNFNLVGLSSLHGDDINDQPEYVTYILFGLKPQFNLVNLFSNKDKYPFTVLIPRQNRHQVDIGDLEIDKVYLVDTDSNNILNILGNFEKVNTLILSVIEPGRSFNPSVKLTIDAEAAVLYLDQLKRDLEASDSLLIDTF